MMSTQEKVILTIAVFGFLAYYAKTLVDIKEDVTTNTRILCLILIALLIGIIFALGVLS